MSKKKGYSSESVLTKPKISVVIPAYCEQDNLPELYPSLAEHLNSTNETWEIIFIDDGSHDDTWGTISSISNSDSRVKGIQFSRNFGHQYALYAGYLHANGDAVICMDGDLQHPPDLIPEMVEQWKNGYKIVDTIRKDQHTVSIFKRYTSKVYYKLFAILSGVNLKPGMADFRLIDKQVLQALLKFDEEGLFIRGIMSWVGFPRTSLTYQCRERHSGNSHYNVRRMIRFAIEGITSFSIIPLRIGIIMGILAGILSFILTGHAFYLYYIGETIPGWATIIAVTSFLFGIMFILLGIIGEYIGRILNEVKGRPRFILQNTIGITSKSIPTE